MRICTRVSFIANHTVDMDVVTIGCGVTTLLGAFALFVSSKPMTLGGVVMVLLLSITSTQLVVGLTKAVSPEYKPATAAAENVEVIEQVRVLGSWAWDRLLSLRG